MDIHAEQLVLKKKTAVDYINAALVSLGLTIIWFFTIVFLIHLKTVAALIIFFSGWGAMKLVKSMNIEYEYELTAHYLDIAKIMGKSSRKDIVSIDMNNAQLCNYTSCLEFSNTHGIVKTYEAVAGYSDIEKVFIDFTDENGSKARLIFTPNEKIKESLKLVAPRIVML